MDWQWQGKAFPGPGEPGELAGFVYLVTAPQGRWYVGKKGFWKQIRRPPLKGRKRARIGKRESGWREYWGSSRALLECLDATGPGGWRRDILHLCRSKAEMSWMELLEQVERRALVDEMSWNEIIQVRLGGPALRAGLAKP